MKIPSNASRIIVKDLSDDFTIGYISHNVILVNANFVPKMKHENAKRYLMRKICSMTHTK